MRRVRLPSSGGIGPVRPLDLRLSSLRFDEVTELGRDRPREIVIVRVADDHKLVRFTELGRDRPREAIGVETQEILGW